MATWKVAIPQISEGEEVGPLHLQETEFIQQGSWGNRRHTETIQEWDATGIINAVIKQAEHLAVQLASPVGIEGGQEKQILGAIRQSAQLGQHQACPPAAPTSRTAPSRSSRLARYSASRPLSSLRLASSRCQGSYW